MISNDYPFNLIRAIYGDSENDNTHTGTTYIKGLYEQINALSETEQTCLTLRYKEGLTWKACGDHFGITAQSIRQTTQKALRKLRHPSRWRHFAAAPMAQLQQLENQNRKLEEEKQRLKDALHALHAGHVDPATIVLLSGVLQPEHLSAHIGELDLSTRAHNALSRIGVTTIRDILNIPEEQLIHTRNLGEKTVQEIKTRIKSYILLPETYQQEQEELYESNPI